MGAIVGIGVLATLLATIADADRPAFIGPLATRAGLAHAAGADPDATGALARRGFLKASGAVLAVGARPPPEAVGCRAATAPHPPAWP